MDLQSTWRRRPFGAKACAGGRWQLAWPFSSDRAFLSWQWPWPCRRRRPTEVGWVSLWFLSPILCRDSSHPCCRHSSPSPPPADPATSWTCSPPTLPFLASTLLLAPLVCGSLRNKKNTALIYVCLIGCVLGFLKDDFRVFGYKDSRIPALRLATFETTLFYYSLLN